MAPPCALAESLPFTFKWPDRRAIGMDALASCSASSPANPRGWFNQSRKDYVSAGGAVQFRKDLLRRGAAEIQILRNMNAQGVVFWSPEGCELRGESFIGDPRLVPVLAPEMDAAADEFFALYRNAGLRVGVIIRPHDLAAGAMLPSGGVNGQVFILTNAPFGKKAYCYTNDAWTQADGNRVTAASYSDLLAKVQYANRRWGCTLFYIDCMADIDYWGPVAVSACKSILNAYPNVLLMPECAFLGNRATNMYAMCAPFISTKYEGYFVPTNVPPIYPKAIGALKLIPPAEDRASIVSSIRAGNIMLVDSWYPHALASIVKQAYLDAARQ
jgi:hypothetical protein